MTALVRDGVASCAACLRRGHLVGLLAPRIAGLLDRRGTGEDRARVPSVLGLSEEDLVAAVAGPATEDALRFLDGFDAEAAASALAEARVEAICLHAPGYPQPLLALGDPPPVLFATGRAALLGELARERPVAIVGARRGSPYGVEVAYELGRGLGAAGVTVVSGLALGIDAAAHRGCLDAGGTAVAVLAGGPDVPYPRRHLRLYERVRERGVVISELPPGIRPLRWGFPARNRIMAGLSAITVVVEAAEPSGSLITSDFAQQLNRTVAAVPGRVTSRAAEGSNNLLKDGALLVTSAGDLLDELFGVEHRPERSRRSPPAPEAPLDAAILDAVDADLDIDGICAAAGLPVRETRAALTRLEAAGQVRRDALGGYRRTASGL